MNKPILLLGFFAALTIGPAHAAVDFAEWDTNRDEVVDTAEYALGFENSEVFEAWDTDSDGILDEDEFETMFYSMSDVDEDDMLTVSEFDRAVDNFFGEEAVNLEIWQWDADGDGIISHYEFIHTVGDSEIFAVFDENEDEVIEPDELESGLFQAADRNVDGELDEDEFLFDGWGF